MNVMSHRVGAVFVAAAAGAAFAGPVAVETRWLPVEIDSVECPDLDGFRSADLYLSFDGNPGRPAVTSDDVTGLSILGGTFYQDPTGANGPRPEGWFKVFPCARWDSYLTMGGSSPFFTPEYPVLSESDWGTTIGAEWLSQPGEPVVVEVDMAKFGDLRSYVRIARITATPGTMSVTGELGVVYFPIPGMPTVPVTATVNVPNCPACWGSQDLDGDGLVGASDLAVLLASWGPCAAACPADYDGDGAVGSSDLAILLASWG